VPGRVRSWRSSVDPEGRLAWIGLEERTLVIGRPADAEWRVAGAGRARLLPPGHDVATADAGPGEALPFGVG
jgi:hypothetical protein